jgi:hypothetical protein
MSCARTIVVVIIALGIGACTASKSDSKPVTDTSAAVPGANQPTPPPDAGVPDASVADLSQTTLPPDAGEPTVVTNGHVSTKPTASAGNEAVPVAYCIKAKATQLDGELCSRTLEKCQKMRDWFKNKEGWTVKTQCTPAHELWCSTDKSKTCKSNEWDCQVGDFGPKKKRAKGGYWARTCKKVAESKGVRPKDASPANKGPATTAKQDADIEKWIAMWQQVGKLGESHKGICDKTAAAWEALFKKNKSVFQEIAKMSAAFGEDELTAKFGDRIKEPMKRFMDISGKCGKNQRMAKALRTMKKMYAAD